MRPALFTNGIKATPDLMSELASAGLLDVAFHVDLTQRRRGYDSEQALNQLRLDYIQRAKGLGLRIRKRGETGGVQEYVLDSHLG
jgi:pyruvate formate-lyase activating enzyme-like uncharacterized protein